MTTVRSSTRAWYATLDPRIRAVLTALGLLAAALVFQTLAQVVVVASSKVAFDRSLADPAVLLVVLVVGDAALLAFAAWYARSRLGGFSIRVVARTDLTWVAGGLLVTFALYALSRLLAGSLGVSDPPDALAQAAAGDHRVLLAAAVLSLVAVAPAEEAFYRGVLQTRFRRAFDPLPSVLGAAVLFALPHALNYVLGGANPLAPGALLSLATVLVTGGVFGYAYDRTGTLLVPVAVHGLYDAALFVLFYAGVLTS